MPTDTTTKAVTIPAVGYFAKSTEEGWRALLPRFPGILFLPSGRPRA